MGYIHFPFFLSSAFSFLLCCLSWSVPGFTFFWGYHYQCGNISVLWTCCLRKWQLSLFCFLALPLSDHVLFNLLLWILGILTNITLLSETAQYYKRDTVTCLLSWMFERAWFLLIEIWKWQIDRFVMWNACVFPVRSCPEKAKANKHTCCLRIMKVNYIKPFLDKSCHCEICWVLRSEKHLQWFDANCTFVGWLKLCCCQSVWKK